MQRRGKWKTFTGAGVVALTLALGGGVGISQQVTAPGVPSAPALNPLAELFEKTRPSLEEALGAKLDFMPQFRAIAASQLLTTADEDLDAHLHWHFPALQGQTLARTRQIARQIIATATVAHYVEGQEIILAPLDNLPKIAAWDEELAQVNSEAFLQLALVHEVIRWHLDRRFHLGKLRDGCHDAEEFDALQALVEGRAQAVTSAVARRLGSETAFGLLALRYLRVPDEAPDPSLKAVSQTALHGRYHAGIQGMAFFEAVGQARLADAEGRVFALLPRQMAIINQPQRWLEAANKKQPDLAAVLGPLENALPPVEWQPTQQTWTPAMLRQVAALLGAPPDRAEKIAGTWYEGRSLVWTQRAHPERQVALSVVRHDNEAGARAHFGFAVDLERKQEGPLPGTWAPTIRVIESKFGAIQLPGFDETLRNDKRVALGDAEPFPVSLFLARTGNLVIELTWHGQMADAGLSERLLQAVRAAAK